MCAERNMEKWEQAVNGKRNVGDVFGKMWFLSALFAAILQSSLFANAVQQSGTERLFSNMRKKLMYTLFQARAAGLLQKVDYNGRGKGKRGRGGDRTPFHTL